MSFLPVASVLVPVDFTAGCFESIKVALEFVEDRANVHVLHVVPHESAVEAALRLGDPEADLEREVAAEAKLRVELDQRGLLGVDTIVLTGDPAGQIIDKARAVGAGLVVMASRRRSGLVHLALGGVSERVVQGVRCAVLVVPATQA